MRIIWHWIKHFFGFQPGKVVAEWKGQELWVGFKCSECGKVDGWVKVDLEKWQDSDQ